MTTKPTTVAHDLPPQLHRLTRRLKAWRSKRKPGQRIPEALWKAAGGLARLHGVNPTASALGLSYYDLQGRMTAGVGSTQSRTTVPTFVELPAPPLARSVTDPGTLELTRPSGARLVLRLSIATPRHLLPLVQAFLRS